MKRSRPNRNQPGKPATADVHKEFQQAVALHQQGKLDAAEMAYRRILQSNPLHCDALQYMGVVAAQRGQAQAAVDLMDQAIAINPANASLWSNRGGALLQLKRHAEALDSYDRALTINPRHADALHNRGLTLHKLQRTSEALASYDRALAIRPDYPEALDHRGIALCKLDRRAEAVDSFRRALRLRPEAADIHGNLGVALFELRQPEPAETHLRKALDGGMRSTEVFQSLALLLYQCGDSSGAADIYRQWHAHDPDNPIARHLAAAGGSAPPQRADDQYVAALFDNFAASFDTTLLGLGYRVPELLTAQIKTELGAATAALRILDAGCGTGLAAPLLKPLASQLVGVDLSGAMLDKARERKLYDELVVGELCAFMTSRPAAFDLIVLADTLVYFGALDEVFKTARGSLVPGGMIAFAIESRTLDDGGPAFRLEPHGRYTHRCDYITEALITSGYTLGSKESIVIRRELNADVRGLAVAAHNTPPPGDVGSTTDQCISGRNPSDSPE
jgi:predicted TPR repeat methyltransferase